MSDRTLTQTKTAAPTLAPVQSGILQRKCACGNHTVAGGECAECGKHKATLPREDSNLRASGASLSLVGIPVMQRKLSIGASNDPLEQEADRIADRVLAAPAHPTVTGAPLRIQRYAGQATGEVDTAPASVDRALASPGRPLELTLRQGMEQRFEHDFSRVRVALRTPPAVQGRLRMGAANDAFEHEADRVAHEVMASLRAPASPSVFARERTLSPMIRRMPIDTGSFQLQRRIDPNEEVDSDDATEVGEVDDLDEMAEVDDGGEDIVAESDLGDDGAGETVAEEADQIAETTMVQAKSDGGYSDAPSPNIERYVSALDAAGGQPLPDATRTLFEVRLGHDFSNVHVHTDAAAAESARSVRALAYTVGRHIVFGAGQYSPHTDTGQHLLAHELTHVIQQSASPTALTASPMIQRAPWGICPSGRELPVRGKPFRYGAAEFGMLAYYKAKRSGSCWASNIDHFEEMKCQGEAGRMIRQFTNHFRSGKNPVRRRSVKPSGSMPAPGDDESVLEAIEGAEPAIEELFMLLRPDIIDFTHREIYDVTTAKQAASKTNKIKGYAKLATTITGRPWTAGSTLEGPGLLRLHFRYKKGELICYGPTDLQKNPGVLAYVVLEDKKSKAKKKSKDEKKSEKQKDKKDKKDEQKSSPTGGGSNIGFGIGIMSTGGGSGNASLSVSIMSNGQAYGTVSAGVVYDSHGKAVGAIGAGAGTSNSSTGAVVASVGAGKDNTALAAGTASAGTGAGNTTAGAGVASAVSGKDNTSAAAGVAGKGKGEGNITASAGAVAKGDSKGVVGTSAGKSGTAASRSQSDANKGRDVKQGGAQNQAGQGNQGQPGQANRPGTGQSQAGQALDKPGMGAAGDVGNKEGQAGSASSTGQSKYGLNIPGQPADVVNKAVEQAGQMDALLQKARPAQRALMEYLAQKEGDAKYAVPSVEWVRLIMAATDKVSDDDLAYLITLEWRVGETTAEKLRNEIQQALKRKRAGKAPGMPPEGSAEVKPHDKLPVPKADKKPGKDGEKTQPRPDATTGGTNVKDKKADEPQESQEERVARLAKRASDYTGWDVISVGFISYKAKPKPGETILAQLYYKGPDPQSGSQLHLTADITGTITVEGKAQVFNVHSSSEFVASDGRFVPAGSLNGKKLHLESNTK